MKEIAFFIDRFSNRQISVMTDGREKFLLFDSADKDEELLFHGHVCKNLGAARTLFYQLIQVVV